MKAMIYKKYIDERLSIILSSLLIVLYLNIDFREFPYLFLFFTLTGINESKEELSYFRTINFNKNDYFTSTIVFSLFKFMIRSLSLVFASLIFSKSLPTLLRFVSVNYVFTIIEMTIGLSSYRLLGKNNKRNPLDIIVVVFFILILLIGLAFLINQFYWPMERYVYGSMYLTLSSVLFGIYSFYKYKGVDYAKDKKLKI